MENKLSTIKIQDKNDLNTTPFTSKYCGRCLSLESTFFIADENIDICRCRDRVLWNTLADAMRPVTPFGKSARSVHQSDSPEYCQCSLSILTAVNAIAPVDDCWSQDGKHTHKHRERVAMSVYHIHHGRHRMKQIYQP